MERRDGGSAYVGKGVLGAVSAVNDILGPALIGRDVTAQAEIDTYMVWLLNG
jgi:enolase